MWCFSSPQWEDCIINMLHFLYLKCSEFWNTFGPSTYIQRISDQQYMMEWRRREQWHRNQFLSWLWMMSSHLLKRKRNGIPGRGIKRFGVLWEKWVKCGWRVGCVEKRYGKKWGYTVKLGTIYESPCMLRSVYYSCVWDISLIIDGGDGDGGKGWDVGDTWVRECEERK